jgi:hypothetical protein
LKHQVDAAASPRRGPPTSPALHGSPDSTIGLWPLRPTVPRPSSRVLSSEPGVSGLDLDRSQVAAMISKLLLGFHQTMDHDNEQPTTNIIDETAANTLSGERLPCSTTSLGDIDRSCTPSYLLTCLSVSRPLIFRNIYDGSLSLHIVPSFLISPSCIYIPLFSIYLYLAVSSSSSTDIPSPLFLSLGLLSRVIFLFLLPVFLHILPSTIGDDELSSNCRSQILFYLFYSILGLTF